MSLTHAQVFPEEQWIRVLFLLSETQSWIMSQQQHLFSQIPAKGMRRLGCRRYYLSVSALAHILERHYIRIKLHPGTGKFTVSVAEILACIRDCGRVVPVKMPRSSHLIRVYDTGSVIGFDQQGQSTRFLTVITDAGGKILTAYPGVKQPFSPK